MSIALAAWIGDTEVAHPKYCISEQLRSYIAEVVRWNPEPKFLADLTRGHRLYGHCAKCGRTKVLDVNQLEQRFGPFFTLDEVRARVRCTKCKRRTNELRLVSDRR